MRSLLTLLATAMLLVPLAPAPATAQDEEDLERPESWITRFDRAGQPDSAVWLVSMPPGWHIRTGPGGIHYDPARTAEGTYEITSTIFLFPRTRAHEGYGIFIGGRNLDGPDQAYSYFLLRGDGSYLVKNRNGSSTSVVTSWTAHDAVAPRMDDGQAKNDIRIVVGAYTVDFHVNGTRVSSVPRADLMTDGIVGLRVSHNTELHVANLDVR